MRLQLVDPAATDALGAALAANCPARAVVHLIGDLGAGKSTLARALLRNLGVAGPIRSPTYTLVERYQTRVGLALHLDLYRIGGAGEIEFLGLEGDEGALWLVEWPERAADALPDCDLAITLGHAGDGRHVRMTGMSLSGEAWCAASAAAFTRATGSSK